MSSLLLANAQVVNEGRIVAADVLIRDDRIERIGTGPVPAGTTTVDLSGKHLLPGLIDDQVHCREPGLTHKATLATESLAALCGGVTSFLDMPNTQPPTTDRAALADKRRIAAAGCHVNYGFYLGATNTNLEEIKRVTTADACGVKVFMGASTGNMLVDDPKTLEGIFAEARVPIATHCEYSPLIFENEKRYRERYGDAVPIEAHPLIRSAEACYRSSSMAVDLAKRHGARLHVLHLTTARELELFEPGPIAAKRITAEVCTHHLWFDDIELCRARHEDQMQSSHQDQHRPSGVARGRGQRSHRRHRDRSCAAHARGEGARLLRGAIGFAARAALAADVAGSACARGCSPSLRSWRRRPITRPCYSASRSAASSAKAISPISSPWISQA